MKEKKVGKDITQEKGPRKGREIKKERESKKRSEGVAMHGDIDNLNHS